MSTCFRRTWPSGHPGGMVRRRRPYRLCALRAAHPDKERPRRRRGRSRSSPPPTPSFAPPPLDLRRSVTRATAAGSVPVGGTPRRRPDRSLSATRSRRGHVVFGPYAEHRGVVARAPGRRPDPVQAVADRRRQTSHPAERGRVPDAARGVRPDAGEDMPAATPPAEPELEPSVQASGLRALPGRA